MNIKNLGISLLLILCGFTVKSQDIKIENGSQFQVTSLEEIEEKIDVNDNQSSFLTRAGLTGKKFRVINLNDKLNFKSKFDIELPKVQNKDVKYFWSVKLGQNVYFFSRFYERKTNTYSLFASELNPSTGKFNRHLEALTVTDDKFSGSNNPFSAVRSIDSTKILILTAYPTKKNENVRYGLKVLNSDMTEVWSKDVEFNEKDKDFTLEDIEIDKKGNIHMIARIRMSNEEKKEKGSKDRYYKNVYSYFYETDELIQYEIGFQNDIIRAMNLNLNENDELVGVGFYSEKKVSLVDSYKGFFYLRIDPNTKEVVIAQQTPFSTDLIKSLYPREGQGEKKADKGQFPPYVMRRVIPLENGKTAVVAEHYVYTKRTTTSNGKTRTTETWYFGNVVVMFIDAEGKMTTASVVKKNQVCSSSSSGSSVGVSVTATAAPPTLAYLGISIIERSNNIYILFNDNPKNDARVKEGKKPKNIALSTAVTKLVTIKEDGSIFSDVLFKSQDRSAGVKMPLMPRSYIQYSKDKTIVFGKKGKTMRATRITIN